MEDIEETNEIRITGAKEKDHFCDYEYEIISGIGKGSKHSVKGKGLLVKTDLLEAFSALNVHLASLDDAFKEVGVEVDIAIQLTNHELTGKYTVTGFKLKGEEEDLKVVLIGNKYISSSLGRMEIETPAIPLSTSSYKHAAELERAIARVRDEVELYKNGKYDLQEENEIPEDDDAQLELHNEEKNDAIIEKVKKPRKGSKKVDVEEAELAEEEQ